jgi:hypothetical protein
MTGHTPGDDDTPPPSSASGFSDADPWAGPPPAEIPASQFPASQFPSAQFPSAQSPGLQFQTVHGTQQPHDGYAQPHGAYPPAYGAYPPAYGYGPPAPPPANGLAIAALVVSCVAVAGLCGWGVGGLLGIVGATLGHVARRQIGRTGEGGAGLALAGIIIGWACMAIGVVMVAGIVLLAVNGSFEP